MTLTDLFAKPAPKPAKGRVVRRLAEDTDGLSKSERMKKLHADPAFKAATAARGRERMKKLHADPAFKAATAARGRERMKKLNADPEFKAKMKALHTDPAFKAKALSAAHAGARAKGAATRERKRQAKIAALKAKLAALEGE